jgi:hypothetical protein
MFWLFVGATAAVTFDRNYPLPVDWLIAKVRELWAKYRAE